MKSELIVNLFESLLKRARTDNLRAQKTERSVFQAMDNMGIDIDAPSKAENAETLGDAVSCFIQYGEYGVQNIMQEVRSAYMNSEAVTK